MIHQAYILMICISCKTEHNNRFCPNCGEKADIKQITPRSIIEEAFSTITNMDKGFLFNFKTLFTDPRKISTDYILGKRKGILNPVSYLILLVTLYLIIENLIRIPVEKTSATADAAKSIPQYEYLRNVSYAAGRYLRHYFKYFWIFSAVPLAASTRLIFRKYNYTEHLAISSFILGQATLIGIISYSVLRIDMVINPLVLSYNYVVDVSNF